MPRATNKPPTHLIANAGDRWTLCGGDSRKLPYGVARALPQWREGHARAGKTLIVCEQCERELSQNDREETPMTDTENPVTGVVETLQETPKERKPRAPRTPTPPPDPAAIEWRE